MPTVGVHYRIGVISDTHVPMRVRTLPDPLLAALAGLDHILHAGDLAEFSVLDQLRQLAPVSAVAGNVDPYELKMELPRKLVIPFGRFRVGLIHGDGKGVSTKVRALKAFQDDEIDALVFGHSHVPLIAHEGKMLLVNPGSATDPRAQPVASYAILDVAESITARLYALP